MNRRQFQVGLLGSATSWAQARRRPAPPIDAHQHILSLRITTGPFAGGYRVAPAGRLNWYFTNLGLIAIIPRLSPAELDLYIRPYLELYLSQLQANGTIEDIEFNNAAMTSYTRVPSDSDNSYAATLLSLAARYLRASANWEWWNTRQATLQMLAQVNIVSQIKTNGLCRVFQLPRTSSVSEYGFTMNNCEDYRGLRDLADLQALRGQPTLAAANLASAHQIGQAIESVLWDSSRAGYRVSDQDLYADTRSFYPGCCCQVFAQAFGVVESSSHDDAAWRFLNTHAPRWPREAYDPFPWCVLGYVAARRNDTERATQQLASTDARYQDDPALVTINELGFYLRTRSILSGLGETA